MPAVCSTNPDGNDAAAGMLAPGAGVDHLLEDGLSRVAAGDQEAFAAIYPGLSRVAFGIALRVLRDPTLAEEVAQDVLLEVWVDARKFDPDRGSGRAWVGVMAHRRSVDRVRAVDASRRRDSRWSRPDEHADPVADQVHARVDAEHVHRALGVLTEVQRGSIELAFFHGLTYRQIADRLGVPLPTIKSRIRDGLIRLGPQLQSFR